MSKDNKIHSFPGKNIEETFDELDLETMSKAELSDLFSALNKRFNELQNEEPDDPESPECLKWLGLISDIEDMMDEVNELIEE